MGQFNRRDKDRYDKTKYPKVRIRHNIRVLQIREMTKQTNGFIKCSWEQGHHGISYMDVRDDHAPLYFTKKALKDIVVGDWAIFVGNGNDTVRFLSAKVFDATFKITPDKP